MKIALRTLRLLALIVWVGALTFFGVVAYVAFTHLPSQHDAGLVVGGCLRILHTIGLVCGAVLIATSLGLARTRRTILFAAIATAMMALTAYSQYSILPRMDADRAEAGGEIARECQSAPCNDFNRLHVRSVNVEKSVLVGGLALTVLLAIE